MDLLIMLLVLHGLCGTLGVRIYKCYNSKVEIFEDSPAPVTCGDISRAETVVWKIDGVDIEECEPEGTCDDDSGNDFIVRRSTESTESSLTLLPDYRRHAGVTVTCQEKHSLSTVSCTIVIKSHSNTRDCQVTINTVNWTVSGSCRVQQGFSSDNNYSCVWKLNQQIVHQCTLGQFEGNTELCSFTRPFERTEGLYIYSLSMSPPARTKFSNYFKIVSNDNITTSCPPFVVFGEKLSCECLAKTKFSPATVRWEGRDSEKLVKTNVQREDNGTQFTCHVTWAGRVYSLLNYTLLVAYGPTDIIVAQKESEWLGSSIRVTLHCKTEADVYPAVTFTWTNVVCDNMTHHVTSSTCSFLVSAGNYGKTATCSAANTATSSLNVSAKLFLTTIGVSSSSTDYDALPPALTINTTVIVSAAVVIIALVLVVTVKRRRNKLTNTVYKKPLPPAQHTDPLSPATTTALHQENTQHSDMEFVPTEITYEAPIPPTQDVHTYMMLHNIHRQSTSAIPVLRDPDEDGIGHAD